MSITLFLITTLSAQANDWASFESAFPTNPCPDGWAACLVHGEATDPEPRRNQGLPQPADLRVGWFDLEATGTFSPFDDLSARRAVAPAAAPAPVEVAQAPEPSPAPVRTAPVEPPPATAKADAPVPPAADGVAEVPAPPEPVEAPPVPSPAAAPEEAVVAAVDLDVPEVETETTHGCDDLVSLEKPALLGRLSGEIQQCLEARLDATSRMTDKDRVSRLLMGNAFAAGDREAWARLVKRHLDEIGQSDPDLCYKYALHLARGGAATAPATIRWADVALENRTVWTGSVYQERVHGLMRLRARAALALWQAAEAEHAEAPSTSTKDQVARTRNLTKVQAREWLDYARAAGKDPTRAAQLCASAAGTDDYCAP